MEHAGPGKGYLPVREKHLQDGASARLRLSIKRSGPQQIMLALWPHPIIGPIVFCAGAKSDEAASFTVSESSGESQSCRDPIEILGCIPKTPMRHVPCTMQNMCRSHACNQLVAFTQIQ